MSEKPTIRLIGLGHPRSGTAYFAKRAGDYGMKVGHEKMGEKGISSWLWVPREKDVPWGVGFSPSDKDRLDFPVYILRDPTELIGSVYYTEGASLEWRAKKLKRESKELDGPNGAAISCLDWIELAKAHWGNRLQFVRLAELDSFFETLTGARAKKEGTPVNARKRPELGNRALEIGQEIFEELWGIYESYEGRARETALQWHYSINPDHHTFVDSKVLWKLFLQSGIEKRGAILDAGCGKGAAGKILKEFGFNSVVGFDYSIDRVKVAKATGGYDEVFQIDMKDVGNVAIGYPVVLCCEVLEHLADPKKSVDTIRKTSDIVGSVPINHPYRAHLQVFKDDRDVEEKLGVKVLFNDGSRAWFHGKKK